MFLCLNQVDRLLDRTSNPVPGADIKRKEYDLAEKQKLLWLQECEESRKDHTGRLLSDAGRNAERKAKWENVAGIIPVFPDAVISDITGFDNLENSLDFSGQNNYIIEYIVGYLKRACNILLPEAGKELSKLTRKLYKVLSVLISLAWVLSLALALGVTAWAETGSAAASHVDTEKTDAASRTAEDPLAAEKRAAKAELDALLAAKRKADYDEDAWAAMNAVIRGGKDAIDAMRTAKGIETAKNTATEATAAIQTKAR